MMIFAKLSDTLVPCEVGTDGVAAGEGLDTAFLAHPVLHAGEEVFGLLPELGVVPVERPGFVRGVM